MTTDETLAATTLRLRGLFATCDERSLEICRRLRTLQWACARMEEERTRVLRAAMGTSGGLAARRSEARRLRDSWTGTGLETTAAAASARITTQVHAAEEAARERRRVAEPADVGTRARKPKSRSVGGVGERYSRVVIPIYDLFGDFDFAATAEATAESVGSAAGAGAGAGAGGGTTTTGAEAATSTTAAESEPPVESVAWWRQQHELMAQNAAKKAAELTTCYEKIQTLEKQHADEGIALSYTPEFQGLLQGSWETFPPTSTGFNEFIDGDTRRCFRRGTGPATVDAGDARQWGVSYEGRGQQCDRTLKRGDTMMGWVYCMRMYETYTDTPTDLYKIGRCGQCLLASRMASARRMGSFKVNFAHWVPVYVAATPDQTNAEGALHDALEWGHIRDPGTEIFYLSPMMRRYVATLFSRLPKVPAGSAWYEGRSYRLIRVHRSIYEDASTAHPNRFPLLPIDGEIDMADANDRATWDLELLGYEGRTRFADYTTVDVERRLTMSKAAARRPYASATSALG